MCSCENKKKVCCNITCVYLFHQKKIRPIAECGGGNPQKIDFIATGAAEQYFPPPSILVHILPCKCFSKKYFFFPVHLPLFMISLNFAIFFCDFTQTYCSKLCA